jgi:hypothetical protein
MAKGRVNATTIYLGLLSDNKRVINQQLRSAKKKAAISTMTGSPQIIIGREVVNRSVQ